MGDAVTHQVQIQPPAGLGQAEIARDQSFRAQGQRPLHFKGRVPSSCGQAVGRQNGLGQSGSCRRAVVHPEGGGRGDAPLQPALAAFHHDVGPVQDEVGAAHVHAFARQAVRPDPRLALADDLEGFDPALGLTVEIQSRLGLAPFDPAGVQGVGGQVGGDDGPAVAATLLQVGIGQVAGQSQFGGGPACARCVEAVGGGLDLQRHAIAGGGQIDDGAQAARLRVAALQGGCGQAGV
ncbi:hypothetical protein D3C80_858350 [compost metagenome]